MADAGYIEINSTQVTIQMNKNKIENEKFNENNLENGEMQGKKEQGIEETKENNIEVDVNQEINLPDVVADREGLNVDSTSANKTEDATEAQNKEFAVKNEVSEPPSEKKQEESVQNQDGVEMYEVIEQKETQEMTERSRDSPESVGDAPLEQKSFSPFNRFRASSKSTEKKETEKSSITFPSIFNDISTSFMSLKSRAMKKDSPSDQTPMKEMVEGTTPSPVGSTISSSTVEQLRVERKNLLGMAKLSIKGLIESSLSAGHILDSDHVPLQQFFVIMESVLRHGLKSPKLFFAGNKQFWGPLEAIEKIGSEAVEITNSVRELPGIKTHVGRARAWLRLALMQKRLADYFRMMVEHRDLMKEFYETESLVLSDEGIVLSGHLVGLNCIDANLCMKGDDLDNQSLVIDYSLYMRDGNRMSVSSESELVTGGSQEDDMDQEGETAEEQIQKLANQKNYLEERNRYLETTLNELQKKAGHTSSSNQKLENELDAAKISLAALKEDKERLLEAKQNMSELHKKILNDRQNDLDMERDTLLQSRAGLDEMLNGVKRQLKHETQMRMDVERELELQISLKQELEVAMKLLEKDIYDKQDSLVILREQLDNVKSINIDIYKKLQDRSDAVEAKSKTIVELEQETKRLNSEAGKLKEKIAETNRQLDVALERADRHAQNLDDSEKRRNALETNLKIEREWREALELQVQRSADQITQLEAKLSMMDLLKQELDQVKNDRDELRATCEEQEGTISDLADHLGQSKQSFQDLKAEHKSITSKTWEKDREVSECQQCKKPFNLARRKHHCRNCGQIYCNTCSDNTMPLASSAKPVRVCDGCHTVLLQRYSAATP